MKPEKDHRTGTTRRGFVRDIAAGAAAAAAAGVMQSALDPKGRNLMAAPEVSIPASVPGEPKYRKLFTTELRPEESDIGYGALKDMFMVFCDGDIIEGCHYFSAMVMGEAATRIAGHGPHKHRDSEVLVALGTDPDRPHDLGGEFEVFMGPEMEKHTIDRPALIYIPEGLIHCPFHVTRVTRPFLFIQAQYALKSVEIPLPELVPPGMRDKYIFIESDGSSEKRPGPQPGTGKKSRP